MASTGSTLAAACTQQAGRGAAGAGQSQQVPGYAGGGGALSRGCAGHRLGSQLMAFLQVVVGQRGEGMAHTQRHKHSGAQAQG